MGRGAAARTNNPIDPRAQHSGGLPVTCPVRIIHSLVDEEVPFQTALKVGRVSVNSLTRTDGGTDACLSVCA